MTLDRLRLLHKLLGIVAGIGMVWLAITGLVILWADDFDLPHTPAPGWIARAYGAAPPAVRLASGAHVLEYDGRWRFDGHVVEPALHAPSQLLAGPGDMYYAIADNGVAIIAPDATLVESLSASTLGSPRLTRAGGDAHLVCAGDVALRCTSDSAEWQARATQLPALLPVAAATETLSLERLFLDLHAGRFLGSVRKLLWTVLAIAMLILPWTGVRIAMRKRRHPKMRMHKHADTDAENPHKILDELNHHN